MFDEIDFMEFEEQFHLEERTVEGKRKEIGMREHLVLPVRSPYVFRYQFIKRACDFPLEFHFNCL